MRIRGSAWTAIAALSLAACAVSAPPRGQAQPTAETSAEAAPCKDESDWNEPTAPRHIFGNTWYVGSCGITAVLIASPEGHILIDGATEQAADGIARSIEASGHRLRDVRVILNTHEHFDHAGGIAKLQQLSGAQVLARTVALPILRNGQSTRNDPQHLELKAFPAIPDAQPVADDGVVRVGALAVQVHATPGHAPGSTSFSWRSCEGTTCRQIVYADSVSALADGEYLYSDHPDYRSAFQAGMQAIAGIAPCDILLTPHPSVSALWPRLRGEQPMASSGACRALAETGLQNLQKRLQKEKAATETSP